MATFIVTTTDDHSSAGKLSFTEAVALAMSTRGADTITFDPALAAPGAAALVTLSTASVITAKGGPLTINGDGDGDGLADVVLFGDSATHHFTVQAGASLTLTGIDLFAGFSQGAAGKAGDEGTVGAQGTSATGNVGFDGVAGANNAEDGTDGTNGGNGESVAGAIYNSGSVSLIRVGFGGNVSEGGLGGQGGRGGFGGSGGNGSDGLHDWDDGVVIPLPSNVNTATVPQPGGRGGDGGDGADGGKGGDGGDAAAAIYNAAGATLSLSDVSFGGRLASGLITVANFAYGGEGFIGGRGGNAGVGGLGGKGGDYGMEWARFDENRYEDPAGPLVFYAQRAVETVVTAPAGLGGDGGQSGNGGAAGDNGDGGNAATVLNHGTIKGNAAFVTGPVLGGALAGFFNRATEGQGDTYDAALGGSSDLVGRGGVGGFERDGFRKWSGLLDSSRGAGVPIGGTDPDGYQAWLDDPTILSFYWLEHPAPTVRAASGLDGIPGAAGADGLTGGLGKGAATILTDGGATDVTRANSLVYAHALGLTGDQLSFNVIRLGDMQEDITVGWRIVGTGSQPVSGADFAGGVLPQGTLKLKGIGVTAGTYADPFFDRVKNAVHVNVTIAGDHLDEPPEGYRFELILPDGKGVTAGTTVLKGTLVDDGITPPGPDPIDGTPRRDTLRGTLGDDVINGLAGNDSLSGLKGADQLNGGKGRDVLIGGPGGDDLNGNAGADTASYATAAKGVVASLDKPGSNTGDAAGDRYSSVENLLGSGFGDRLTGDGHGNRIDGRNGADRLSGLGGNDVLLGGKGNDRLDGGAGNDRMAGAGGADVFVFDLTATPGQGKDVIVGFNARADTISFTGTSLGDLSLSVAGGDTVLTHDGGQITLLGKVMDLADIDFLFA